VNAFKAAADGAMLPLIVFSLAFGVALTATEAGRRQAVVTFFQGTSDAMLSLVAWVLRLAPVGVFALAVPLGARMGLAAADALAYYIALLSAVSAGLMVLVLYPAAVLLGRVRLGRFAKAAPRGRRSPSLHVRRSPRYPPPSTGPGPAWPGPRNS
jgi:Na+/H+-dicarboxylate symporter